MTTVLNVLTDESWLFRRLSIGSVSIKKKNNPTHSFVVFCLYMKKISLLCIQIIFNIVWPISFLERLDWFEIIELAFQWRTCFFPVVEIRQKGRVLFKRKQVICILSFTVKVISTKKHKNKSEASEITKLIERMTDRRVVINGKESSFVYKKSSLWTRTPLTQR